MGYPPFLSDGTPIFLYYYQSARTNWIYLTMSTNLILVRYFIKLNEINKLSWTRAKSIYQVELALILEKLLVRA